MVVNVVLIGAGRLGVSGRDSHRSALGSRTGDEKALLARKQQRIRVLYSIVQKTEWCRS